jgi:hypothetical protein
MRRYTVMCAFQHLCSLYRGADKSVAPPGRKQATATEDCDVHVAHL